MLPLIVIGVVMATTPQLHPERHVAAVRSRTIDLHLRSSHASRADRSPRLESQIDGQPVGRPMRFAPSRRWRDADLDPVGGPAIHRLQSDRLRDAAARPVALTITHLDAINEQPEITAVIAPVRDLDLQDPVDVGRERPRPTLALTNRTDDTVREQLPAQEAGVLDQALDGGDPAHGHGEHATDQAGDLEGRHSGWPGLATWLAVVVGIGEAASSTCLLLLVVTFFEFIKDPAERAWPVRVARTALLANIVIAVSFLAFVAL